MIKSIINFSQLEDRLDAEYYKPEYLRLFLNLSNQKIKKFVIYNARGIQPLYGSSTSKFKVLTSQYITKQGIDYSSLSSITEDNFNNGINSKIQLNDILIYTTGANVGNVGIWQNNNLETIASNHVNILRVKNIDPYFLYTFLASDVGQAQFKRATSGAAQAELYPKDIAEVSIPAVSKSKQKRLGNLIKTSYKKSQLAEQKYQEAQKLLNNYLGTREQDFEFPKTFSLKFSKLEGRFDGEYYQTKSLNYLDLLKKSGGEILKLGDITEEIKYGTSDKVIYQEEGIPFLRVTDINKYSTIDQKSGKFISESEAERLSPYQVAEDDLLVSRTGTLGSVVYINDDLNRSIFGSYFIKVTPKKGEELLPLFVSIFLNSKIGKLQTEKLGSGGIQTNLTIDMIKGLIFPVLDIKKQKQICNLYNESLMLQKESKQFLEKAKQEVENIIEKGGVK